MRVISAAPIFALFVAAAAWGDTPPAETGSEPALGVARVSALSGDVATRRGDSGDWIATAVNIPLVEGDSIRTQDGSRVEVQLDFGNVVRVTGDSEVQLVELGEKRFRVRVLRGTAQYSEWRDSPVDIDIETPKAAVRPEADGRYRIFVAGDWTLIEIREGRAEIALERSTTALGKGQSMTIWTSDDPIAFETGKLGSTDAFDRWAAKRDKELRRAATHKYISRDIYGVEALDSHGRWRRVGSLGWCWFPRVTAAWVPYRHGRWVWVSHYGWTWVPEEPWGWAPSHWGRWHYDVAYGWGWYPGTPRLRHAWRPALVSFVWAGSGLGRPGYVGWSPLGPWEPYRPWYGRGWGQGARQAPGNSTVIVNVDVNAGSLPARGGRPVRASRRSLAMSYLTADELASGSGATPRSIRLGMNTPVRQVRGPVPVVPSRASQGRVLPASSTSVRAGLARGWDRVPLSGLRHGSTRSSFDDQRDRMRRAADDFSQGYARGGRIGSSLAEQTPRAGSPGLPTAEPPGSTASVSRAQPRAGSVSATSGSPERLGRAADSRRPAEGSLGSLRSSRQVGSLTPATRSGTPETGSRDAVEVRRGTGRTTGATGAATTSGPPLGIGAGSRSAPSASRVGRGASNPRQPAPSAEQSGRASERYAPRARSRVGAVPSSPATVWSPSRPRRSSRQPPSEPAGGRSSATSPGTRGQTAPSQLPSSGRTGSGNGARDTGNSPTVFVPRQGSRVGTSRPTSGDRSRGGGLGAPGRSRTTRSQSSIGTLGTRKSQSGSRSDRATTGRTAPSRSAGTNSSSTRSQPSSSSRVGSRSRVDRTPFEIYVSPSTSRSEGGSRSRTGSSPSSAGPGSSAGSRRSGATTATPRSTINRSPSRTSTRTSGPSTGARGPSYGTRGGLSGSGSRVGSSRGSSSPSSSRSGRATSPRGVSSPSPSRTTSRSVGRGGTRASGRSGSSSASTSASRAGRGAR